MPRWPPALKLRRANLFTRQSLGVPGSRGMTAERATGSQTRDRHAKPHLLDRALRLTCLHRPVWRRNRDR